MSFAWPAVLIALLVIPLLVRGYTRHARGRARRARAFTTAALLPSVAPSSPGPRRHLPAAALIAALTVLIVAAARPRVSSAVPVTDGDVMLVEDTSASMAATDVAPSRLGAALAAARTFVDRVPASIRVGSERFSDRPVVLQSPTGDKALVRATLIGVSAHGHTAIGDALQAALSALQAIRTNLAGRRSPGAIVLISDGTSTQGSDPLAAARAAAAAGVKVFTVSVGTAHGTIPGSHGPVPVPLDDSELRQIATVAHGRNLSAGDASRLGAVYSHLAAQIGHRTVQHELTAGVAGGGLVLLIADGALSLLWFGRLI